MAWINAKPDEAAAFLAADRGGRATAADWLAEMKQPGVALSPTVHGLGNIAAFTARTGNGLQGRNLQGFDWAKPA
jgi:hypothetical protein